jgi:hypothetical protein
MKEDLREYAYVRCMELLRKERTYELPGHLRGEPVVVNVAVVGNKLDVGELRKLAQASEGRPLPWRDLSGRVTLLTPRQVEVLASQVKVYETRVYAVRARAGLRIIDSVITTTAQIDALNWPT